MAGVVGGAGSAVANRAWRRAVALLATAAALAALLALAAITRPAHAQGCQPAGGAAIPPASAPDADFVVRGGGWGHGVGMSQYGAQGAARLGCSATDILTTYYTGVDVAAAGSEPQTVRVSLWPERPGESAATRLRVRAHTGTLRWSTPGGTHSQPRGAWWEVRAVGDGRLELRDESGGDRLLWRGGQAGTTLSVPLDGEPIAQLSSKPGRASDFPEGRPYAHGQLQFRSADARVHALAVIGDRDGHRALDRYLWGLAEMPSSWPAAALQSQAITGRSYALARHRQFGGNRPGCFCDVYDSTSDQVYAGYLKESEGSFGARWVDAVNASRGTVLHHADRVVEGFYSSSHGGQSESNAFSAFFGGPALGYLRPVDDSRWELASDSGTAGVRRWAHGYSAAQLGEAFGVGPAESVTLPPARGAGGRVGVPGRTVWDGDGTYGGVRIVGRDGQRTVSGLEFVNRLGVPRRSELFEVLGPGPADDDPATPAPPAPDACAPSSDQSGNDVVARVAGADRVATAVAASAHGWQAADTAVLATAWDFADALAASTLAARLDAPLLLTPGNALAGAVASELDRLGADRVVVVGGTGAVAEPVADALRQRGLTVQRLAGGDRFATAAAIAREAGAAASGDVALALGTDFPDALAAGALAATDDHVPVLLTTRESLHPAAAAALADLDAQRVRLIGGTAVIAESVAAELAAAGYDVDRLAGPNRFATSAAVAAAARAAGAGDPLVLASGMAFPDALAAGPLAARLGGTLLLTPRCALDDAPAAVDAVEAHPGERGAIVGGTSAVSDRVREQATERLDR